MATPTEPVYCLRHRDTETGLRCARCNDPICPECMVQAAVGHICPSCVTWERNPVAQVAGSRLLAAVGAGLGAGLLIAIAVTVLSALFGGFFHPDLVGGGGISHRASRPRCSQPQPRAVSALRGGWIRGLLLGDGGSLHRRQLYPVVAGICRYPGGDCHHPGDFAVPLGAIFFRLRIPRAGIIRVFRSFLFRVAVAPTA